MLSIKRAGKTSKEFLHLFIKNLKYLAKCFFASWLKNLLIQIINCLRVNEQKTNVCQTLEDYVKNEKLVI